MSDFLKNVEQRISMIDPQKLYYNENEAFMYAEDYARISAYAVQHELPNTYISLAAARALHNGMYRGNYTMPDGTTIPRPYLNHCISVCLMLINLHLPLEKEDMDILLSAALLHDAPAFITTLRKSRVLSKRFYIDPAVEDMVDMIYTRDCVTDEDFEKLFARVTKSRIGALIKLADRGDVVERLHRVSVWRANEYIQETRLYYLPMCINARELYPELDRALGVLQWKMNDFIQAAEIFVARYTDIEKELTTQILQVMEDNSRMRARIQRLKEED